MDLPLSEIGRFGPKDISLVNRSPKSIFRPHYEVYVGQSLYAIKAVSHQVTLITRLWFSLLKCFTFRALTTYGFHSQWLTQPFLDCIGQPTGPMTVVTPLNLSLREISLTTSLRLTLDPETGQLYARIRSYLRLMKTLAENAWKPISIGFLILEFQ